MAPDFHQLFVGRETAVTVNAGYVERSITLGGVTFFCLIHESAAERVARLLANLPVEERQRILETLGG
jgi:hypothetical protein